MAKGFVHPDRPDVFVSYAQVDDQPVPGWVTGFVDGLEIFIRKEMRRDSDKLYVFRDFQLPTGTLLERDLKATVESSATLLLIMSTRCRQQTVLSLGLGSRGQVHRDQPWRESLGRRHWPVALHKQP